MKHWTESSLIESGYEIRNAKITYVSLNMKDGFLDLQLDVVRSGFDIEIGGHKLGTGHINANVFTSNPDAAEYIMRVMDIVGVTDFSSIESSYIRIAIHGLKYDNYCVIGNIIEDKWLDIDSFFSDNGE